VGFVVVALIGASFVGAAQRTPAGDGGVFGGRVAHMHVAPLYREVHSTGAMREVRCAGDASARCFVTR
jgi:hypothetical protein